MPEFSVDTTIDVEFEVFCARCGASLCGASTTGYRHGRGHHVQIEPCENCMKKYGDEEWDKGHDDGYNEGYNDAVGACHQDD